MSDPRRYFSATVGDAKQQGQGRPVAVWLLCAFYALTGGFGLVSLLLLLSGALGVPAGEESYLQRTGPFDLSLSFLVNLLMIAFAIAFFRLRAGAVRLIAALVIATLVADSFAIFARGFLETARLATFVLLAISLLLMLVTLWYSVRLKQKGILS